MWAAWISLVLLALQEANAEEFNKYDFAAVKRFDDELRRLGIVLPSLSKPDEPRDLPMPTVSSPAGDFESYWTKSQFGRPIAAFEGIPYAKPPVGNLRFKVAQPISRLSDFKAKKPGSKCPQRDEFLKTNDIEGNEDCLFVNVYVPEKIRLEKTEQLPVIFYIHGGAYEFGQGDKYQPHLLLDQEVILVTFNYRLGPLGFLTTEDEVMPGNIGLKDQVAALRWVHENIASFGGNPNLVTLAGHSSGSACAEFLMLSPLTKGLFHRVLSMSGSAFAPWAYTPQGETKQDLQKAAQHLDCPYESSEHLLNCLQTKTAAEITVIDRFFKTWRNTPAMPFKPVVEGDVTGAVLPSHPQKLFSESPNSDVPYLTSVTSEEGSFFAMYIFLNDTIAREFDENFVEFIGAQSLLVTHKPNRKNILESLRRAYFTPGPFDKSKMLEGSNLFSDVYFFCPIVKSERNRRKQSKSSTYFRYFSHASARSFLSLYGFPSVGVSHGDDLFYMFTLSEDLKPTPEDVLISMIVTEQYATFARDGVPSSSLVKTQWLPVTTEGTDIEYLHIASPLDIKMKKNLFPERCALLNKLLGDDEENRLNDEL